MEKCRILGIKREERLSEENNIPLILESSTKDEEDGGK